MVFVRVIARVAGMTAAAATTVVDRRDGTFRKKVLFCC